MFGNLSDGEGRQAVAKALRLRYFSQIYLTAKGMKQPIHIRCGKVRIAYADYGAFTFHRAEDGQSLIGLQYELQVDKIMPRHPEISRTGFKQKLLRRYPSIGEESSNPGIDFLSLSPILPLSNSVTIALPAPRP
jgi:hypothetical protein